MLVSVIIPTHNYGRFVARAIRSCYDQSLERGKFEIIVIDDASTDVTKEVLEGYKDIIRLISLDKNVGLAEARNIGVKNAKAQYVVFVDADDYVHHDMLKIQSTFLTENNRLDSVAVDYYLVDEYGEHIERVSAQDSPIACGIMFRKDLLFDIGMYDKKFKAREDEDMRIRFLKKYSIYNIILPLYRYRKHDTNLTNNKQVMDKYRKLLNKKHASQ